jgi:large conductance mechanosensitive channel
VLGFKRLVTGGRHVVEPTTRFISPGLRGFRQFLMRGNVLDLAVAVVIGAAFNDLVKSLVAHLLTPLIAAVAGEPDFSRLAFRIHRSTFGYGAFLNDVVSFLVVAAAVYFVVVMPIAKANELRRRGEQPEEEEPALSDEARLLMEIRDLLAGNPRQAERAAETTPDGEPSRPVSDR